MTIAAIQRQLDTYARLHGLSGMDMVVGSDGLVIAYPSLRQESCDQHRISCSATSIGTVLSERIGRRLDLIAG